MAGALAAVALLLGVAVVLAYELVTRPYQDLRIALVFTETTCRVTGKRVESEGTRSRRHQPSFDLVHAAAGVAVHARGFDDRSVAWVLQTRSSAERILAQFRVGASYPCWVDPAQPQRVVLVRQKSYLLPLAFLWGVGLFIAILHVPEDARRTRALVGAFGVDVLAALIGYPILEDWWRGWPSLVLLGLLAPLAAAAIAMSAWAAWLALRRPRA